MKKTTCTSFYCAAVKKYGKTEAEYWAFSAGFVIGQAEKVRLGACRAAMFRPLAKEKKLLLKIIRDACKRFELEYVDIGIDGEIWIVRKGSLGCIEQLLRFEKNSIGWHHERAYLCGVPSSEVDEHFHHRPGYGRHPELKKVKA
jgi:hypothetical protein